MRRPIEIEFATKCWNDKEAVLVLEGTDVYIYGRTVVSRQYCFPYREEKRYYSGPSILLERLKEWESNFHLIFTHYGIRNIRSKRLDVYVEELWKKAAEKDEWFSGLLEKKPVWNPEWEWC